MNVRRVPGEEHAPVPEPLGEPDVRPPHRRPRQIVQPDTAAGSFYNHFAGKEELLEALLADLAAAGDASAASEEHKSDFTDPEAIRWHVRAYWEFHRDNAATLLALRQAAMVNDDFARKLARFGADQVADIRGHLTYITEAGLELPASPTVSLAMMSEMKGPFIANFAVKGPFIARERARSELHEARRSAAASMRSSVAVSPMRTW